MTPPLKTTLLLIRHGESTANVERKLTGRAPGVPLTARGRQQAAEVAAALAKSKITQIYSSPVERARETAAFLEHLLHIPVQTAEGINETDCGDWTGWSAEECTKMPEWKILRDQPENFCFPGGESFDVITERAVRELREIAGRHPGELIACYSHADTIRLAAASFLDVPLASFMKISVDNCSVTVIEFDQQGRVRVPRINQTLNDGWLPQR